MEQFIATGSIETTVGIAPIIPNTVTRLNSVIGHSEYAVRLSLQQLDAERAEHAVTRDRLEEKTRLVKELSAQLSDLYSQNAVLLARVTELEEKIAAKQ